MVQYEDFSLKIEPKRDNIYPVIVLRSPAGEGRSSFTLPFDPAEIGNILFELGQTVRGSGTGHLRDVSPAATLSPPQQIGDQLFNALFSGPARSLLDRSLGMVHGSQHGLRIKLHIDPEDPGLAQLASLPWEFLYRKETRDFLNLSRFTPILRYLDVQRPYTPLPLDPPLRIMVVISAPVDYVQLDLDRERSLIEASWARHKGVQVEFIRQATILALQDRLADQPYHVLHYMGHGDFDERTGQGVLVMEDEDRRGVLIDGSTLGVLLRDVPTMRLVFLNACETARVTREKGLDPFAGAAAAMVMAGIPAVVAMQFPISDSAAITFSQKFYPLLARGDPVDAAVAEGRRAIRLAEAQSMEWGTPVLFMRAPRGVIFQVSEAHFEKALQEQILESPVEVDEAQEQRLAELYTQGLSSFWLEEWEKAARSFQAIVDVRPDYEDVADKLAEARLQAKLRALYTQAQAAQEAKDWSGALAALEELAAESDRFKDTAERLQIVRVQKRLADLYSEARRLHQAQQWLAVVNVFSQIHAIDETYPDADKLLPTAEREAAEQSRQAELHDLYSNAVREMNTGSWQEARRRLLQVQELETGFRETERLLARVEVEIAEEEAVRQQEEQISTLYKQALDLASDQKWQRALAAMGEIDALDPQFADPEGIKAKAQVEIERASPTPLHIEETTEEISESEKPVAAAVVEFPKQPGEAIEPEALREKADTTAHRLDRALPAEEAARPAPRSDRDQGITDRLRRVPLWGKLVAGSVVLALLVFVIVRLAQPVVIQTPIPQEAQSPTLLAEEGLSTRVSISTEAPVAVTTTLESQPLPPEQRAWAVSAHADDSADAFTHWMGDDPPVIPTACSKCHSSQGIQDFYGVDGTQFGVVDMEVDSSTPTVLTCEVCHNKATETLNSVIMPSGIEITNLGPEARCMQCHQGRESTISLNDRIEGAGLGDDEVGEDLIFINIHYYAATATKYGTIAKGGYEYEGKSYDGNFAHVDQFDSCIECHDPHSLEVRVDQCSACHAGVASVEDLRYVRMNGSKRDYDGDGDVSEGISFELDGLREMLYQAILAYADQIIGNAIVYESLTYPYFFNDHDANRIADPDEATSENRYSTWTPRLLKAAYNYQVSLKDPGAFAHGGKYIIQLLYDSIEDLNTVIPSPINLSRANRIDAGHFAGSEEAYRHWDDDGYILVSCSRCHSAEGLPLFINNGVSIDQPLANGMKCANCHNDLETFSRYQVDSVTFPSGAVLSLYDSDSNLCMICHQGRQSTVSVDSLIDDTPADTVSDNLRFTNIHYLAAGATRFGKEARGGYEYAGKDYVGLFEHVPSYRLCTECHDVHGLWVQAEQCGRCHADVETEEDMYNWSGIGLEVETMRAALLAAIQQYARGTIGTEIVYDQMYPYFFIDSDGDGQIDEEPERYNPWSPRLLKAAYNYQYASKDPGGFAHNGKYILQILYDSIQDLGRSVSGFTRP